MDSNAVYFVVVEAFLFMMAIESRTEVASLADVDIGMGASSGRFGHPHCNYVDGSERLEGGSGGV
jgi:hypothetical protein